MCSLVSENTNTIDPKTSHNTLIAIQGSIDKANKKENFDEHSPIANIVKRLRSKSIEKLRREGRNEDFKILCEIGFAPMVSKDTWKLNHKEVKISTLFTVADEAFALLTMENNIEEWMKLEVHGKESVEGEESVQKGALTRYTSQGTNKDGTKKGWTLEGKRRFNKLYDAVILERRTKVSETKEIWTMAEWKKEGGNKKKKSGDGKDDESTIQEEREEEEFVPRNGFNN